MSLEINPPDVVKLILQYLKENGLFKSLRTLQEETQVSLNTVDSVDTLKSDLIQGKWESVLKALNHTKLTSSTLMSLFEQIIIELVETNERETARYVLKDTLAKNNLHQEFPDRCLKLDNLIMKTTFDPKEAYGENLSRDKKRAQIAEKVMSEVMVAPSSRLLTLLGDLLKYQVKDGIIPTSSKYDLFTGEVPQIENEPESMPIKLERTLKYGSEAHIEVARFSGNGKYLITGSVDGIIEVLDPITGKLRSDLPYQAEEAFMVHNDSVLSLAYNKDDEMLASGSKNGQIKIWKILNGNCLRKYENAHPLAITSLLFAKDNTQVISASREIKVHGLKSGKQLKEFRGHETTVNDLVQNSDGSRLVSGASDGYVKIWDFKTTECLLQVKPQSSRPAQDCDIISFTMVPVKEKESESFLVCSKNNVLHLMGFGGQVLKMFRAEKSGALFQGACVSAKGGMVYGLADDGYVYCFEMKGGKVVHSWKVETGDVVGIAHHPGRNVMVVYNMEGNLMVWRP